MVYLVQYRHGGPTLYFPIRLVKNITVTMLKHWISWLQITNQQIFIVAISLRFAAIFFHE